MDQVRLAATGLEVSAQGLGCMGMSHGYGPADDSESVLVLRRAVELGVTLWDTADYYAGGENERLLATVLAEHRDEVQVATKFGLVGGVTPSGGAQQVRGDPAYVREACEGSLRRLGVDVIDLYYQHRVDVSIPIEETVGAMAELVTAGKVRYLGLSEVTATELRRAHAVYPISAVQSEWSLWSRDVEASVVPACRELGVGFVPYSPLGRGFLTGQLADVNSLPENDIRRAQPRLQAGTIDVNRALVAEVQQVAAELEAVPAQVALAWVHRRSDVWGVPVVPIPGTKRVRWLEQNVAAMALRLPAEVLQRLDRLAARAVGDRHPQMGLTSAGGRS